MTFLFFLFIFVSKASENPNLVINRQMKITDQELPVKITREIFYPDKTRVSLMVTCHFSEIGVGPNVTVKIDAQAEVTEKYISHLESKVARIYTPKKDYFCNAILRESRNRYTVLDEHQVLIGEEIWQFNDSLISNHRQ